MPEAVATTPHLESQTIGKNTEARKPSSETDAVDSRTNFQKIIEFHKCFGLKHADNPQMDIFEKDPKCVKLRRDLIREEFKVLL